MAIDLNKAMYIDQLHEFIVRFLDEVELNPEQWIKLFEGYLPKIKEAAKKNSRWSWWSLHKLNNLKLPQLESALSAKKEVSSTKELINKAESLRQLEIRLRSFFANNPDQELEIKISSLLNRHEEEVKFIKKLQERNNIIKQGWEGAHPDLAGLKQIHRYLENKLPATLIAKYKDKTLANEIKQDFKTHSKEFKPLPTPEAIGHLIDTILHTLETQNIGNKFLDRTKELVIKSVEHSENIYDKVIKKEMGKIRSGIESLNLKLEEVKRIENEAATAVFEEHKFIADLIQLEARKIILAESTVTLMRDQNVSIIEKEAAYKKYRKELNSSVKDGNKALDHIDDQETIIDIDSKVLDKKINRFAA